MKCPRCDEWLAAPASICSKCGLDLAVLRSILDLKTSIQIIKNNSNNTVEKINELEHKIGLIDVLVTKQYTSLPTQAKPPEHETAVYEELEIISHDEPGISSAPFAKPVTPDQQKKFRKSKTPEPSYSTKMESFSPSSEIQLGQKWLLIAGLAITVLAVGYFLKYSFDKNWIGPVGRVSLAYAAGFAFIFVGESCRRKKFDLFGLYLFGGGIAVLYFANYAAFQIYFLIDQTIAFGLMVLVTIAACLLSLKHDIKWLAILGIIGGFLTPIVMSTGIDNQVALMTYISILNIGILTIATFKRWHLLNKLGFIFTWSLFAAWYSSYYHYDKFLPTIIYLNVFFLIHASVPFAGYFIHRIRKKITGITLTIPNAFIAFGYSFYMIHDRYSLEHVSVTTISYAALFLGMASVLYRMNRENIEAVVLLIANGTLFLVITVPILFSEHWITIFWLAQGLVLLWGALRLQHKNLRHISILLILVATGKYLFYDYPFVFHFRLTELYYHDGYFESLLERWITISSTTGALYLTAQMLKNSGFDSRKPNENYHGFFIVLFGIILFIALNIETGSYFKEFLPVARFTSISVLWAIFAIVMMIIGFIRNQVIMRRCAIGLFAGTILKVFMRDMANVDTPYRILSFLVLGLLLMGASYLYHRFKSRILPDDQKEKTLT